MLKKYNTHKYRAKLRYKQPTAIWYCSFTIIGIALILFFKILQYLLEFLNSNYFISNTIFLLITIGILVINAGLLYFSPLSFSKMQKIKYHLIQIIEHNNFFYELNGQIRSSMEIVFYFNGTDLHLEVYPLGGKYAYKLDDLTKLFESKLNMTVISVQNDYPDHTVYILSDSINNILDATNFWE